jgi:hypothetical protein
MKQRVSKTFKKASIELKTRLLLSSIEYNFPIIIITIVNEN